MKPHQLRTSVVVTVLVFSVVSYEHSPTAEPLDISSGGATAALAGGPSRDQTFNALKKTCGWGMQFSGGGPRHPDYSEKHSVRLDERTLVVEYVFSGPDDSSTKDTSYRHRFLL